jgi:hypothetical protein
MKLGRVQSKHDPRTLQLETYLTSWTMPAAPPQELLEVTAAWPMLANDHFNCCTSAAAGHMVHHWTAANHHNVFLQDQDIIRAHAQLTGDRLMDCVSMMTALKFWRGTGIGSHRIHSYVNARAGDADALRTIIHLFGSAYIGLDLPQFACSGVPTGWPDIPWSIPPGVISEDAAPRPDMGHCVTAVGYGQEGAYVVTWGRLKTMSWEFFHRYNVEAYAVLSYDWVEQDGTCPSGFDCASLMRDLALVERLAKE